MKFGPLIQALKYPKSRQPKRLFRGLFITRTETLASSWFTPSAARCLLLVHSLQIIYRKRAVTYFFLMPRAIFLASIPPFRYQRSAASSR